MKTDPISIRLEAEEKETLFAICANRDIPVAQVVRGIIREWIKEQQAKEEKAKQKKRRIS